MSFRFFHLILNRAIVNREKGAFYIIEQICWRMQRYFSRERKPTRRVNRSPTSRESGRSRSSWKSWLDVASPFSLRLDYEKMWNSFRSGETTIFRLSRLSSLLSPSPLPASLFLVCCTCARNSYSLQSYIKCFFLSLVVITTIYFLLFIDN